ncbi:ADP-ribosylglycohydrolase family protein [Arthrobacter burdickii]|uniref:ADP-ribosylglycohydrolase family protein n=1 Tax=Arthrobacter burdickii TaxID=3035920 RepID=A0ABT8K2D0_9MICC|nr:ADP-ribosylglycohydrolase family protein [Arthrobacter burdickii]MDN4611188.1 ADP-ribosylglycohydrolase family protein [Arthrobacter burdickii]
MTTDSSTDSTDDSPTDPSTGSGTGDTPADVYEDRVLGCLLGTMAGDAYGVLHAAGDDPAAALDDPGAMAVSAATQLTLYTVDGLVEALEWANDGVAADETACLWLAYLRWLVRQGEHLPPAAPAPPARWLDRQDDLLAVHDADADTVRALLTGAMGTQARPLNPEAQGPGALMRSAPFGLVPRIPAGMVERLTVDAAALTHGSPAAKGTAALFSGIIRSLAIEGRDLDEAVRAVRGEENHLAREAGHDAAAGVAAGGAVPPQAAGGTLAGGTTAGGTPAGGTTAGGTPAGGTAAGGTTAAGTFEAALQAVRETAGSSPGEHLAGALAHAAAAGRPDASPVIAASLAGGIVGALHGTTALPPAYLTAPGVAEVVRTMARTLLAATTGS